MDIYGELHEQREEIAYFMRRLYGKNLTTCSGGNISVRGPGDVILITPSALDKGELRADQIGLLRMNGDNLTPALKPTMEAGMHRAILARRPDIRVVVHAHPVFATTFSCLDLPLETALTSEAYMVIGKMASAPFAPPGTDKLAEVTAEALANADVALMRNHGVITVGKTLLKAFDLLEVTEAVAKMTFIARSMGQCRPLDNEQKNEMARLFHL